MEKKISFSQFQEIMKQNIGRGLRGIIVFKESNWKQKYSLKSRSYVVSSDAKFWDAEKCGNSLFGSALDGSDNAVRLEKYAWEIEYCYIPE